MNRSCGPATPCATAVARQREHEDKRERGKHGPHVDSVRVRLRRHSAPPFAMPTVARPASTHRTRSQCVGCSSMPSGSLRRAYHCGYDPRARHRRSPGVDRLVADRQQRHVRRRQSRQASAVGTEQERRSSQRQVGHVHPATWRDSQRTQPRRSDTIPPRTSDSRRRHRSACSPRTAHPKARLSSTRTAPPACTPRQRHGSRLGLAVPGTAAPLRVDRSIVARPRTASLPASPGWCGASHCP